MAARLESTIQTITNLNTQVQRELKTGRAVQNLFLTPPQIVPEIKAAIHYRPLREVSGDIYHFHRFDARRLGFFFADATGHGVSAALITSITLMELEKVLSRTSIPGHILGELSQAIFARFECSYFLTGLYMLFDIRDRRLFFANAGHNPFIVLRPGRETARLIEAESPLLGLPDSQLYPTYEQPVRSGDTVVVYSDGLVEATNAAGVEFSLEALVRTARAAQSGDTHSICAAIMQELDRHTKEFRDDVSLVALQIP